MAENRLLRENNPEPGERRGYVPQHLEAGSQEYSKTEGSDGRLHTKSMIVDRNGEPFEKENPVPVQLTGSTIENEIIECFQSLSFTTEESQIWIPSGQQQKLISRAKKLSLRVSNSHDCEFRFSIPNDGKETGSINSPKGSLIETIPIGGNGVWINIIDEDFKLLRFSYEKLAYVRIKPKTTPNEGSISLKLILHF